MGAVSHRTSRGNEAVVTWDTSPTTYELQLSEEKTSVCSVFSVFKKRPVFPSIYCNNNWSKFNTSKTTNLERENRFEALILHFGFVNAPLTDRKCTTYES